MKDAIHHLKHVQKKVIQSARKSQVLENQLQVEVPANSLTSLTESPNRSKRRPLSSQFR